VGDRKLILIVDDDADGLEALLVLFADAGYRTRGAATIAEAVRAFEDGLRPDVVVADVLVPGRLDALTAAVDATAVQGPRAHLIFYSAGADLAAAARDAGALAWIEKPYVDALLELVGRLP
jgi:DNA-binding NtrC family response regulator